MDGFNWLVIVYNYGLLFIYVVVVVAAAVLGMCFHVSGHNDVF
jgi:hypothetical protein